MDLNTVRRIRPAHDRADLVPSAGEVYLAGGTWLFSQPQPDVTGLIDLTTLAWSPTRRTADGGLSIAGTCTLAQLAALPDPGWAAHPLFFACCSALLGSFKIWNAATVAGNIANALPAGPMISLAVALDADAVVWQPDGGDRRVPVVDLIVGNGRNDLSRGEVIRSIDISAASLASRTAFRKIALSPLGRSGAVIIGRRDQHQLTVTVSAATVRPEVIRFPGLPARSDIDRELDMITTWFTDPHGAADWRRAMAGLLAAEVVDELAADPR